MYLILTVLWNISYSTLPFLRILDVERAWSVAVPFNCDATYCPYFTCCFVVFVLSFPNVTAKNADWKSELQPKHRGYKTEITWFFVFSKSSVVCVILQVWRNYVRDCPCGECISWVPRGGSTTLDKKTPDDHPGVSRLWFSLTGSGQNEQYLYFNITSLSMFFCWLKGTIFTLFNFTFWSEI